MKKIALLVLTITISLTMAFGVSAKSSLTIKKVTNKSKKVTITFPSKAKWKVKIYAKKANKKKYKKIVSLTTPKVSSTEIKIKKQSKRSTIKVITNKKGKKKTYSSKIKVVAYTKKKNNSNKNISKNASPKTFNASPKTSDDSKLVYDFEGSWREYYKKLNEVDEGVNIYQKNDYLLIDDFGGTKRYGFICGSTNQCIRWYNEGEYNDIMNEVKKIIKATVNDNMSDQEKGFRLGAYLAKNVKTPESGSPHLYDCLINKKSMCMGLAEAYSILCKYIGIDCECVYNDGHMWNIMKVGKYWYMTDVFGMRSLSSLKTMRYNYLRGFYEEGGGLELMETVKICFKTNEFLKAHPSTDLSFIRQSKKDGTPYILDSELEKQIA